MELEAKFRAPEIERVEEDVKRAGFELVGEKHQIDHYYIVGETDDDGTRHYFRVREDDHAGEHSIDYHRVLSELETAETELSINSADDAMEILTLLGHEVKCVVDKDRTEYAKDEVLITMDHIEELGDFVEIELDGELSEETERTFEDLIDQFDLNDANRVTQQGYPELILQHEQ